MRGRGEAGARRGRVLVAAAVVMVVGGVVLAAIGITGLRDASDAREQAEQVRRDRRTVAGRTEVVEREADAPLGRAETVTASVSDIIDAGDTVVSRSAATSDVLTRAVRLANDGDLAAARRIYSGEAARSVQELEDELARARDAQAAAQRAVAELTGTAP